MISFNNLLFESREGILTITINRPEKLNALNLQTMQEIRHAIQEANENPEVRGIIFTGTGQKAFAAGADISELSGITELNARKYSENGQETFEMIEMCSKPVIAAVNGYALGGGCELALACHIRVASDNAQFGLPEVSLGTIPGYGGTQRLTQIVGKGRAFEFMMTGDMISASQAHPIGLVNHVTSQQQLIPKSIEIIKKIIEKAPIAIAQVVESINAVFNEEEDGYQTEANSFGICCKSEDFKQGVAAFLEKRKVVFKGK
jgi:enoyl-CoA hydratase